MTAGPMIKSRGGTRVSVLRRVSLRVADMALRWLTMLTDVIPAKYRFGHWNRLLAVLAFGDRLPVVGPVAVAPAVVDAVKPDFVGARLSCMILAGDLDTGGVETVVAALAPGLSSIGFDVEVVCSTGGAAERRLRETGVHVSLLPHDQVGSHIALRQPDVIQLHRLDPTLIETLGPWWSRTVPVLHAMESYLTGDVWDHVGALLRDAPSSIAVSESVRDYFEQKTGTTPHVVENGVPPVGTLDGPQRAAARAAVGRALGTVFEDGDIVVLGLQRFSDQKNPAGLVDAFLLAAEQDPRLHLVVAGAPNSWLEIRRADIIRRRHANGDRVHFLGDSDSTALFQGSDVFALDSFSEGGPIAAVEAVAHGLPIVVTDVGFARELVDACRPHGVLITRANEDFGERSMARQRRKLRQSNRQAFADGILQITRAADAPRHPQLPERFTESAMIHRHAEVLRSVSGWRQPPRRVIL